MWLNVAWPVRPSRRYTSAMSTSWRSVTRRGAGCARRAARCRPRDHRRRRHTRSAQRLRRQSMISLARTCPVECDLREQVPGADQPSAGDLESECDDQRRPVDLPGIGLDDTPARDLGYEPSRVSHVGGLGMMLGRACGWQSRTSRCAACMGGPGRRCPLPSWPINIVLELQAWLTAGGAVRAVMTGRCSRMSSPLAASTHSAANAPGT